MSMSEFYEDEEINVDTKSLDSKPVKKERYKSSLDQTKRREQSKINLAKSRATRMSNLKLKKEQESCQLKVMNMNMKKNRQMMKSFILQRRKSHIKRN